MIPSGDYTLRLSASPDGGDFRECRVRIYRPGTNRDSRWELPVVLCSTYDTLQPKEALSRKGDAASEAPNVLAPERVAAEVMVREGFGAGDFVWVNHEISEDGESFYLVVFSHYEVRGIVREDGIWRREIGSSTLKPLDRESVAVMISSPL